MALISMSALAKLMFIQDTYDYYDKGKNILYICALLKYKACISLGPKNNYLKLHTLKLVISESTWKNNQLTAVRLFIVNSTV